jgi:hypothetical protein
MIAISRRRSCCNDGFVKIYPKNFIRGIGVCDSCGSVFGIENNNIRNMIFSMVLIFIVMFIDMEVLSLVIFVVGLNIIYFLYSFLFLRVFVGENKSL